MRVLGLLLAFLCACNYTAPLLGDASGDATNGDAMLDGPPPGVWLHPYKHRKAFSIIGARVSAPGGGLTSFPIVVSLDDRDLEAGVLAADGRDIAFTAGDGLTVLDSEIASYSAGRLQAWVRIPSLTAVDRLLFIYYGHDDPPAPMPTAVWTGAFLGVWHLEQAPNPGGNDEMLDSSSGNRQGDAEVTMLSSNSVPGQLGRAITFDGIDDTIAYSNIDLTDDFTISAWVNVDNGSGIRTIFANSGPGGQTNGIRLFINTPGTADKKLLIETGDGSNGSLCTTAAGAIAANVFAHVVAVVDRGAGSAKIFVNGSDVTVATAAQNDFNRNTDFEIGSLKNDTQAGMSGVLDEVSFASEQRAPEWLATAFANQSAPSTFFTLPGPEEQEPPL